MARSFGVNKVIRQMAPVTIAHFTTGYAWKNMLGNEDIHVLSQTIVNKTSFDSFFER